MQRPCSAARAALAPLLLAAAAGCDSTPEPVETLELAITPYEVPLGAEVLQCQEMALPASAAVDVDRVSWRFSTGAHGVQVYVSADASVGPLEKAYDCPGSVDLSRWHLLAAAHGEPFDWTLPHGAALRVEAPRSVLVRTHYLNTGSAGAVSLTAEGSVRLRVASPGSIERRAAAIFGQDRDIDIPPHATAHVEGTCALPGPGAFLVMMGHYHAHGRVFQAWIAPAGKDRQVVYRSEGSADPAWVTYPELTFGVGDSLGWSCDFENSLQVPIHYGSLEATQEQCNLFAFYTEGRGDASFLPCVLQPKTQR